MPYDSVAYHAMVLSSRYFVIDLPRAFSPFHLHSRGVVSHPYSATAISTSRLTVLL